MKRAGQARAGRRLTVLIGLSLLSTLAGCITTGAAKSQNDPRNAWIGRHFDDMIRRAGPPDREYTLSDGGRVVEYHDSYKKTVIAGSRSSSPPPSSYETRGSWTTRPDGLDGLRSEYEATTTPRPGIAFNEGVTTRKVTCGFVTTFVTDAQLTIVRWSERDSC